MSPSTRAMSSMLGTWRPASGAGVRVMSRLSSSGPCAGARGMQPSLTIPMRHLPRFIASRSSPFHSSAVSLHSNHGRLKPGQGLEVTYVTPEGREIMAHAKEGANLLDVAHAYDIELEGACEGSLACSTCHLILEPEFYEKLPEPTDEENDMLDLAFGLTDTSRLGCQIKMTKDLEGMKVRIPNATRNVKLKDSK